MIYLGLQILRGLLIAHTIMGTTISTIPVERNSIGVAVNNKPYGKFKDTLGKQAHSRGRYLT